MNHGTDEDSFTALAVQTFNWEKTWLLIPTLPFISSVALGKFFVFLNLNFFISKRWLIISILWDCMTFRSTQFEVPNIYFAKSNFFIKIFNKIIHLRIIFFIDLFEDSLAATMGQTSC